MLQTEKARGKEGARIPWADVEAYLDGLAQKGCAPGTLKSYRWNLKSFWEALEDGQVSRETASQWRDELLASGYHVSTVNHRLSSVNGLLAHLGLWEYQARLQSRPEPGVQPELTRGEYLRLLAAARASGREQVYLLVKVFACTGITVQELPMVTVEAVKAGQMALEKCFVSLPRCLCGELLAFAREKGVESGPVFVTRTGRNVSRTNVTAVIQRLGQGARVAQQKCNPRCLRKLYQATQANIRQNVAVLIEQAHERLVEQEQIRVGWQSF